VLVTSIPLRRIAPDDSPIGIASGCLVDYRGRRFILSVSHAVKLGSADWVIELGDEEKGGTQIYRPAHFLYLGEITRGEGRITPVDYCYAEVRADLVSTFQHLTPLGPQSDKIPRHIFDLAISEFTLLDDPTDAMIFEPRDFYYRGCTPSDASGWIMQIYVFPAHVVPPCRREGRDFVLDIAVERINGPLASVVRMKVARLPKSNVFLGVMVNRVIVSFPSESGWILNGPGDHTARQKGHVLTALYPREAIPVDSRPPLDRRLRYRRR
jgi:hypothetical protein